MIDAPSAPPSLRTPAATPSSALSSPPARRSTRASWRDPRLAVGLVLVLASVVVGARVLGSADRTVPVWAASRPLAAGTTLGADDLTTVDVRFASQAAADRYLAASGSAPDAMVLTRTVEAGELLPRGAVAEAGAVALVEVPLDLAAARVPAGLAVGDAVDVWAAGAEGAREAAGTADLLARDVTVTAVSSDPALGAGTGQVVIGLDADDAEVVASVVSASTGDGLVLVRRAG